MTADEGDDPLLTVWDSFSGYYKLTRGRSSACIFFLCFICSVPVRTFFEGLGSGCVAVGLSHDAQYLATLTSASPQVNTKHHHWIIL